jgi:hypothetical protein
MDDLDDDDEDLRAQREEFAALFGKSLKDLVKEKQDKQVFKQIEMYVSTIKIWIIYSLNNSAYTILVDRLNDKFTFLFFSFLFFSFFSFLFFVFLNSFCLSISSFFKHLIIIIIYSYSKGGISC